MLSNYIQMLRNEIVSNFGIYEAVNEFKFIFSIKADKDLKVDFSSIYERMFGSKKNYDKYSLAALHKFYGGVDDGVKQALLAILSGDFEGVKSRNTDAIKILSILSDVVDIIERGRSKEIIESVRDAENEFNNLRVVLSKLTGAFKKEDSDKFKVITKLYSYFKNKNSSIFNPLVKKYEEIAKSEIDYNEAIKVNKNGVNSILELFNSREADYTETINELSSLSPKLFGKDVSSLKELITDQISDAEIDNYKPLISFYLQHLDSLVDLAKEDLPNIILDYSALDDNKIEETKTVIKSAFGEDSIVHERILGSKEYLFAISFAGRYEPILKFIEDNKLKVFTVLMVLPPVDPPVTSNPSLRFLITSLSGDMDDAIDEFGRKPNLDVRKLGNSDALYLIGTGSNTEAGKEHAMMIYLSTLAVIHGFDAKKLPFVQKFVD
jgi:hypothetical protein